MKMKKTPLRWVRLDNAAKIYPAARRRNWSNVYRQSVTLYEDVDKEVLQSAVEVVVKRFPFFLKMRVKKEPLRGVVFSLCMPLSL